MLTGHCLCGAVRYEITSQPLGMAYCHCEECRRATGSAFNTTLFIAREGFRIVAGEDALGFHESSPENKRHFCTRCGSPLFKHYAHNPKFMSVRAGSLDSDPGVRPGVHVWVSEKAPWYEISDDLPQHAQGPPPPPQS
jgi:hypothetical protein